MRDQKRIIEEILSRKKSAHTYKFDIFGQTVCNVDNEEYKKKKKKKFHIATPYREYPARLMASLCLQDGQVSKR